jgi:hypothetical protein
VTLTGLQAATENAVGFVLEWMRPDGSTAYSISLTGPGTTNA